ncbi:ABC transporter permease [Macrococcus capreoli]|uniref:ABC transporter permease n=1 Tax=Macrococcus capreoli TaxID=2982690 RepID=UPI0021D5DE8F|nr:iron ABC transporter permease [Macrococcus sp. TMW 2.2395]MCU7557417.1 iron ABC transporter permease [Macrococcus sp. TMW 2.2395]
MIKSMNVSNLLKIFIYVAIIWFIVAFLVVPNVNILLTSFYQNGTLGFESVTKILRSDKAMESLKNSFILAFCLAITCNIVGIFLVLITDYFDIKGSKLLLIGYSSVLVFGGIILANGYNFVYGENGIITHFLLNFFPSLNPKWFQGFPAVLFMMSFACTSLHMIFLRGALKNVDYQTIEAARNMGASQTRILTKVVLPTLKPVLITLTILLFQTGLGALSGPLIIGGPDFQTISPMILRFAQRPSSRDLAALLSIVLGVAQLVLLLIVLYVEKKTNYASGSKVKTKFVKQKIQNKWINTLVHIIAYIIFLIYTLPLLLVVLFSFTDSSTIGSGKLSLESFTLKNYLSILTDEGAYKPFLTSIVYSGVASFIVIVAMLYIARLFQKHKSRFNSFLEMMFYIPWLLPGLLFALGLIITYDKPNLLIFNNVLTGTIYIMLIGYIIVNIPFTLRVLKATYYSFDNTLEEAAKNLGAKPFYTFMRVILPVVLPTALAVFALNFNGHLSDYDLSVFLYYPTLKPLGVEIYTASDAQANIDAKAISMVYSVLLMIINSIVIYFVYGKGNKITTAL